VAARAGTARSRTRPAGATASENELVRQQGDMAVVVVPSGVQVGDVHQVEAGRHLPAGGHVVVAVNARISTLWVTVALMLRSDS